LSRPAPGFPGAGTANFGVVCGELRTAPMVSPRRMNFGHAALYGAVRPNPAQVSPAPCRRRGGVPNPKEKTKLSALSAEFNTMKAVNKLAVLLSLAALTSVVASAKTDEQAYLESCLKGPGVPVPVAVVTPSVGPEYTGAVVQLEFLVDATGKPAEFSVKSDTDNMLAAAVVDAVKQWRFKPAMRNGAPVATKVSLPVKIVDESTAPNS
jgi:protein TonB